jgi:hypothetical protein
MAQVNKILVARRPLAVLFLYRGSIIAKLVHLYLYTVTNVCGIGSNMF